MIKLKDLFLIKCKKCGSEDVDLDSYECHICGTHITATCWNCGNKYDYEDEVKKRDEAWKFEMKLKISEEENA